MSIKNKRIDEMYGIDESSDVFVDSFVLDRENRVVFIKFYGRDTVIRELQARMTLGDYENGIKHITIHVDGGKKRADISGAGADLFDQYYGKIDTIYGSLVEYELSAKLAKVPDKSNKQAVLLYLEEQDKEEINQILWNLVGNVFDLPLLNHWKDLLLSYFIEKDWIRELYGFGIHGYHIDLSSNEVEKVISGMIKAGDLVAHPGQKIVKPTSVANDITDIFGEVIDEYSRQNAIDDGFLVDVTEAAKEVGIRYQTALTNTVFGDCVEWGETDTKTYQDERGRLHDVVWMASLAMRKASGNSNSEIFRMLRVPRDGDAVEPEEIDLKVVVGPGDEREPVVTIMHPHED